MGTIIGKINVLRINMKDKSGGKLRVSDKALVKMEFPKESSKRAIADSEGWAEKLSNEEDLTQRRERLAELQDEIMGKHSSPKVLHLCDPDAKGRRSYVSIGKVQQ